MTSGVNVAILGWAFAVLIILMILLLLAVAMWIDRQLSPDGDAWIDRVRERSRALRSARRLFSEARFG